MNVAIFSWRDLDHPKAGGAELYTHHVASGFASRGHQITLFASRPRGAGRSVSRDGYRILRAGSESSCRFHAARWLRSAREGIDVVVDQVNTLPFFSPWIAPTKTVLLIFQLAREVWLAEAGPAIGRIGYLLEPLYLRIYRRTPAITISASSAATLAALGLRNDALVIEVAIDDAPPQIMPSPVRGRVGFVGRITPSKRIDHMIRALALLRQRMPHAELVIVGRGRPPEIARLKQLAAKLGLERAISFTGPLSNADRDAAMARFDAIALTSLREGWGIVVSEAARFGVPAVVYPVPGLIDSVRHGESGIVCGSCDPAALAESLGALLADPALRDRLGRKAQERVKQLTVDVLVDRFEAALAARCSGAWR